MLMRMHIYILVPLVFFIICVILMAVSPDFKSRTLDFQASNSKHSLDKARLAQSHRETKPVDVAVYYETLCPDSIDFINNQLYPTWKVMPELMNIILVPFGKARVDTDTNPISFHCQHGARECKGNIIQTCALDILSNISASLPLINCMEQAPMPELAGEKCAKELWLPYGPIEECSKGEKGRQLEQQMANLTNSLNPPLYFVPWITFNDEFNQRYQRKALHDLHGLICDLTGTTDEKYSCMVRAHRRRFKA